MNADLDDVGVVSWNLHGSAGPDLARVAEELLRAGVDVAGLQEVRSVHARRLGRALGWQVSWVFKHFPLTPLLWWRAEGMAILSRHPIVGSGQGALTTGVSRWSHRRRVAQWCDIDHPAGRFRLVNVHLASSPGAGSERVAQASRAVRHLDAGPSILTGDLNAPDEADVMAVLRSAGLRDAWDGPGPGHTNPAGSVRQRLDYVFPDPSFAVVACTVPDDGPDWAALSDHLPVHARLRPLS